MDTQLHKRAFALTRRAHWHLRWETYAPVLALAALFVLLFVIGASAGLWQRIGDPWRLIALLASLVILTLALRRAAQLTKPNLSAARRRVERDNGFAHRPLDSIDDKLAMGTEDNQEIWQRHINKAAHQVARAKNSKLRPALAPIDRYFLRFAVPCALVLAVMVGLGDNYERLRSAVMPKWIHGASAGSAHYEAWIDPPQYTGRPPSYFKNRDRLSAPEGSIFTARISGIKTAPRLIVSENGRTRRLAPKRLGPESFEVSATLSRSARASFRIGTTQKIWHLDIGRDGPPSVDFVDPPGAGKRDRLIFTYNIEDDFGVETLRLSLHPVGAPDMAEEFDISLPGSSVRSAETEPAGLNLTKHKWADKLVSGHLIAMDGKGQTGISEAFDFIIPNKIFIEPLAKAVAEQRVLLLGGNGAYEPLPKRQSVHIKNLEDRPLYAAEDPTRTIERAPMPVQRAALLMDAITDKPVGVFNDPSVYMGLRHSYRHLMSAGSQAEIAGLPDDLWAIAMRAEFGRLGDAKADMQAAERALNNAMARRAPQREIDALFDRYNAAVDRFMEELTLKAIKDAKDRTRGGDGEDGEASFQTDQIQELLNAIEEANRMGDTAAARKALAQLAELLENMQIQMSEGGGGSGDGVSDSGMSDEMKEALEEMNDLLGEQRQLRDETQAQSRRSSDGKPSGDSGEQGGLSDQELAAEQKRLSDMLDTLEDGAKAGGGEDGEGFGGKELTDALSEARRAMRDSEQALENGEYYRAGEAQSDAIDALREAGQAMYASELERAQEENGENGEAGMQGGEGDPFGRENDEAGVGDDVDIPEIDDRQRARDLLEQLRERSGDQGRDKTERDFLDRLLERF